MFQPITDEMEAGYIASPSYCPFCTDSNISAGSPDYCDNVIIIRVTCLECGEVWNDVYTLTSINQ